MDMNFILEDRDCVCLIDDVCTELVAIFICSILDATIWAQVPPSLHDEEAAIFSSANVQFRRLLNPIFDTPDKQSIDTN